ncbi:MAG: zinc ribbon domain-containing protein YjdM [Pseudomonadota bacterium]
MSDLPNCPECGSAFTYDDGIQLVCPECGNEWSRDAGTEPAVEEAVVRDANGTPLADGDTVTVIKDLKVKGIRLVDGDHDIDCRIEGIGAMKLKSEFVKKA